MIPSSNEVVALQVNGKIISGFGAIDAAKYNDNNVERIITRDVAYFMAACDLGYAWQQLANAKTIMIKDENGYRLPDGYYTNGKQEIFEIVNGEKHIIENAVIVGENSEQP